MSRIFLVDTSGSLPVSDMDRVKSLLNVGDRVVMFDHLSYDMGLMDSQSAIDNLRFYGGGGTLLAQALEFVASSYPNLPVTIFTDGCLPDRDEAKEVVERFGIVVEEIVPFTGAHENLIKPLEESLNARVAQR